MRLTAERFAYWRILFGTYLAIYYLKIAPYAIELYGGNGALPVRLAASRTFLPMSIFELNGPAAVYCLILAAFILSVLFIAGFHRREVALALFFIEAWCSNRNIFTFTPDAPFVHWLLLACVLIPAGEPLSLARENPHWQAPFPLIAGAWLTLALGYAYAAQGKLLTRDPAWIDGSALYYTFNFNPARYLWYGNFFLGIPRFFFYPLTWATIFLQLFGPVLILWRPSRFLWLTGMTVMHVFALFIFNLQQLTLGMLMYHAFIFVFYWDEFHSVTGRLESIIGHFLSKIRSSWLHSLKRLEIKYQSDRG